jgi:hypothetical protein
MENIINTYTCPRSHITVTRDADEGVTPMMKACPDCGLTATSGYYRVPQTLTPTHEWYKPKFPERYADTAMRYHIQAGGLAFRKIGDPDETEAMPEPQPEVPAVVHELKTLPEFFEAIYDGSKTFEVRKNDRDFKAGDSLQLLEWTGEAYTGRSITAGVGFVLPSGQFGIHSDYCVMSIYPQFPFDTDGFEYEDGFPITTFCG